VKRNSEKLKNLCSTSKLYMGRVFYMSVNSVMLGLREWNKCVTMRRSTIHTTKSKTKRSGMITTINIVGATGVATTLSF
jgi:hypothetical protein